MSALSVRSPEFLAAAERALAAHGEVLVLHRPSHAAGGKHWYLLGGRQQLITLLGDGGAKSSFSVFLTPQLTLRGTVDLAFADKTRHLLDRHGEILLALPAPVTGGELDEPCFTDSHDDLAAWLQEHQGVVALAGSWPPYLAENGATVVTAYVPDPDGTVRPGAY